MVANRNKLKNEIVQISNLHPTIKIPFSNKFIINFIISLFKKEKKILKLLLINFIDDKTIKNLNLKYMGHNYYTDIITFDYSENKSIEGELFISLDTIKDNSKYYNVSFKNELLRVIAHGCLHLAGYNDSELNEKELIRNKENFYINAKI